MDNYYLPKCQGVIQLRSHGYWHWYFHSPVGWDIPVYNTSRQSKSFFASYTQLDNFVFYIKWSTYGDVRIVLDGQDMSIVQDWDIPNIATITGTTIITMQPGQKVSDSLFFCCMKLTRIHYLTKAHSYQKKPKVSCVLISFCLSSYF